MPSVSKPRSTFNRSHGYKTTLDGGLLIPFFLDQSILPGDTCRVNVTGFARLATPIYPIMDNMVLSTFFFGCSKRILWENFTKMHGEQEDPGDSISYTVPQVVINNAGEESLPDYFGLPTKIASNISVSALPFRMANMVWNYWFRDENLQDSLPVQTDDGPDTWATHYGTPSHSGDGLMRRGKRHDYFTSGLPWPQKGDSVSLPLGTTAEVEFGSGNNHPLSTGVSIYKLSGSGDQVRSSTDSLTTDYGMVADLTNATAATINELRQAEHVQRLLEKDARAGTRFAELIKSHFGVTHPEAQWRPEYLGGGVTPVNITPIARTDSSPGELGAMATIGFRNHGFVISFTEHSIIMGFLHVGADLTYQEGIERDWLKTTRYDEYYPVLANLGEQTIENREIYVDAATITAGTDDDVFAYQERWAEYRYKPSRITGQFRSNATTSLDPWHLSIEFGSEPTLDDSFIRDNPPIDRAIVTPTEPHFIFDSYIDYQHTRVMPIYSIPGLVQRF